jgi:hypothetical protein
MQNLAIFFTCAAKKIYRLKEDQAFWLSRNWDEEKKLRGIRLQISSLPQPVPPIVYDRQ